MRVYVMTAAAAAWWIVAEPSWAWGARGHEWLSGVAIEHLPDSVPVFVRTPETIAKIAVLSRELDRSKGSGPTHDAERDPGHWISMSDDGAVMGVPPLTGLPEAREGYDTLLRCARRSPCTISASGATISATPRSLCTSPCTMPAGAITRIPTATR